MNATADPATGAKDHVAPSAETNTKAPEVEFSVSVPAPAALAIHLFAAGRDGAPITCDMELNTAVNGTAEVTPGNVIAWVDTSKFPVPTSTAADTWSLIGNDT